jgi:hypothetical protein
MARARTKRAYRLPDDPKGLDAMTEPGVSRQEPGLKCRFPPDKVNKCGGAGASAAVKYEDSRVEAARLNSLHASRIDWLAGLLEGEGYFGTIPSHVGGQTYRYPRVGISMTDRDVIARVAPPFPRRRRPASHGAQRLLASIVATGSTGGSACA